jgi:hypothetical protein
MKNIDTRIKKLEDVVKPNEPHVLVAFGKEAADQKRLEYQEAHPREAEPLMIIVEFVDAPVRSDK